MHQGATPTHTKLGFTVLALSNGPPFGGALAVILAAVWLFFFLPPVVFVCPFDFIRQPAAAHFAKSSFGERNHLAKKLTGQTGSLGEAAHWAKKLIWRKRSLGKKRI